jgi:hypothetical protein
VFYAVQKFDGVPAGKLPIISSTMRRRSLISSTNEKKAMAGEVYLYSKWFDSVTKFDGACAGQHPQAPLYFNPYQDGEDDQVSPIISRHP